ncbi:MAG: hypothetical protein FWE08_06385 [Oscillospiraceae bacterium]|nr:hypothetical protein [Oscillospiraceae bacterium]
MKKLLVLCLVLMLVFAMSACGGGETEELPIEAEVEETPNNEVYEPEEIVEEPEETEVPQAEGPSAETLESFATTFNNFFEDDSGFDNVLIISRFQNDPHVWLQALAMTDDAVQVNTIMFMAETMNAAWANGEQTPMAAYSRALLELDSVSVLDRSADEHALFETLKSILNFDFNN